MMYSIALGSFNTKVLALSKRFSRHSSLCFVKLALASPKPKAIAFSAYPRTCNLAGETHLSKHKSDLKQKCTQLLTPFSGKVFHALSHYGIHFAWSVSLENQLNGSFWLAVREFPPLRKWFLGLKLGTKRITPCEGAWYSVLGKWVRNCIGC